MKRVLSVILILFFSSGVVSAGEKIAIDNRDIQEYRGKIGKWVLIDSKNTITYYTNEFSSSLSEVFKLNNLSNSRDAIGDYAFVPFSEKYLGRLEASGISRNVIETASDEFIWPLDDVDKITSVFGLRGGKFHEGLDIPAPSGIPIRAAMEGRVLFAGYYTGHGKSVEIEHRNNFVTRYSHNSVNLVKKGDFVKKGQIIGFVGSSGNSTGNHLHFEVRCNCVPLDPLDFLPLNKDLQVIHTIKNWK